MDRITLPRLNAAVDRLNRVTGSPRVRFVGFNNSQMHKGHFFIEKLPRGYQIRRVVSPQGAEMAFGVPGSRREVWAQVQAMVSGYLLAGKEDE